MTASFFVNNVKKIDVIEGQGAFSCVRVCMCVCVIVLYVICVNKIDIAKEQGVYVFVCLLGCLFVQLYVRRSTILGSIRM